MSIDSSFGVVVYVGLDFCINECWLVMVDVCWMCIVGDVYVNGMWVGKVMVDLLVYGFSVGYCF